MNLDSEKEYANYLARKTQKELEQILDSIDRSLYKKRFEMAQNRLSHLRMQPKESQPVAEIEVQQRPAHSAFEIIVLLVSEFLVGTQGFMITFGLIWGRGESKTAWTIAESLVPWLLLYFTGVSIYSLIGKFGRFVKYSLIGVSLYYIVPFLVPFFGFGFEPTALIAPVILIFVVNWVE